MSSPPAAGVPARAGPTRVAVTGSSGLIGSALVRALEGAGSTVIRLVRRAPRPGEVRWDPAAGRIDAEGLVGVEAVVHLAGEPIAAGRWTAERKRRIRESRVQGTGLLAGALASLPTPPGVLVSGSASGYYGHRGDEVLTEDAGPGDNFTAEVAREWEAATAPAAAAGIRVTHVRLGIVLSPDGGALAKMLPVFRCGLGGQLGHGRQWMSWASLRDTVAAIRMALIAPALAGPVNVCAPEPVTNAAFTRALARALGRPALLAVPAFALRLALGQLAEETLLASTRMVPTRLERAGFAFRDPALGPTLERLLG